MAFDITKFPRGLTSLVGFRDMGRTPQSVADQLVGTIDATNWFLLGDIEVIQAAPANVTGVGSYIYGPGEVPPGEAWWLHAFQVTVDPVIPAGNALHLRPALVWRNSGLPVAIGARASGTAGEYVLAMANYPQQLILPAGSRLGYFVEGMTGAGPIPTAWTAVITRLRA